MYVRMCSLMGWMLGWTTIACGSAPPSPRTPGERPALAAPATQTAPAAPAAPATGDAPTAVPGAGPLPATTPAGTPGAAAPDAPATSPDVVVTTVELAPEAWPDLQDDLGDAAALTAAIDRQLDWFRTHGADKVWRFGGEDFTAADMAASLRLFRRTWRAHYRDPAALRRALVRDFRLFRVESNGSPDILFSGYYGPIYRGSRTRTQRFRHPLYRVPDDLVRIRPGLFDGRFLRPGHALRTAHVFARHDRASGEIVPYYTRQEIDQQQALAGRGLEIAYLERYFDVVTLQIQGSGYVELEDGRLMRLNFAAGNHRGYRAIGRILVEEGAIPAEELSMQAIDAYFTAHPEEIERVCFMNPSYVFFSPGEARQRLTPDLYPHGVFDFPLTTRRSIAADKRWFPGGGLAFLAGRQRQADGTSTAFSGFAIDQDTGGGILDGHIDIFLGVGAEAGESAGRLRDREGRLYFLIARRAAPARPAITPAGAALPRARTPETPPAQRRARAASSSASARQGSR